MIHDGILEEIRARLENKIQQNLSGFQGLIIKPAYNSMMPLHVQVSLLPQLYTLTFLRNGRVHLERHCMRQSADLCIECDANTFAFLCQNPDINLFNELERCQKIKIVSVTKKGKNAEKYIRRYLTGY